MFLLNSKYNWFVKIWIILKLYELIEKNIYYRVFLRKDMHLGTDNTGPAFQKSIFAPNKYLKRE